MKKMDRTKAPTASPVIVTVSGGVADILCKPKGVEVRIVDYDVDGEDADRLDRDPDGQLCCIQTYRANEQVVSHQHWPTAAEAVHRTFSVKEKPA